MPSAPNDDVPPTLIDRIREQARAEGRTLQEELADLLAFADELDSDPIRSSESDESPKDGEGDVPSGENIDQ